MMKPAIIFAVALSMAAQEARFDVRSRLVLVPVNIADQNDRAVRGLDTSDFRVFDNGREQRVTVDTIDTGVAPIALVVAVQSAGISAAVVEKVRNIGGMIQPLITGDRGCGGLLSFDQRITWLQECTNNPDLLRRAFYKIRPLLTPGEDKEARLFDAVQAAIEHLRPRAGSRLVLLLISESRDRGSETELELAQWAAQSAGITVYAATYSAFRTAFASKVPVARPRRALKPKTPSDELGTVDGRPPNKYDPKIPPPEQLVDALGATGELVRLGKVNATEALAKSTGGTTYSFTKQKALEDAIVKLGAELHAQYVLSFVPEASSPGYHRLDVRVAAPGEFHIRARPGYWSTDESQ